MSKHQEPPSGPNPVLSAKTGIRLTVPELCVLLAITASGVLGWSRLDGRLSRIEERMDRVDRDAGRTASVSQPVLVEPEHGN